MPLAPGTRIDRYTVTALLGAGGMGEVYRAFDERLGREVALKVLPADVAGSAEALARLEQEARAAACLSHPGIVTLFDVVVGGDGAFLTMELVVGRSLREVLRPGPLPTGRALEIAREISEALAHAHAAGIVHRDLKPENVMIAADGRPRVLDFGLAKAAVPPGAGGADSVTTALRLTRPGTVVGTVAYMAPEQASGGVVDRRADQFALGVMLQEMLTGRRPFGGGSVMEMLTAILRDEPAALPPAIESERPGLRTVLARCLAREPQARYDSTADLAMDLGRLLATGAPPPSAPPDTGRVAGRTRLRTGAVAAAALFALVIAGFWATRRGDHVPSSAPSSVPEALESFRQAQYYDGKEDWQEKDRSIPLYERAVSLDPAFGAAWEGLAGQYARKVFQGDPERSWEAKAVTAIGRALDLNPDAPEALVARANLAYTKLNDFPFERIAADLRHALAVAPDSISAHDAIGSLYMHTGLLDQAFHHFETALRLEATDEFARVRVPRILWYEGRYEEALALFQARPQTAAHFEVPVVLAHLDRDAEAKRVAEAGLARHRPGAFMGDLTSSRALVLAKGGDEAAAQRDIEATLESDDGGSHFHHAAYNVAVAQALLGRKDDAVAMLERVAREGMPCHPLFASDPFLASLRGHPAFDELLSRMKRQHEHFRKTL